jgi:hypothetical protein
MLKLTALPPRQASRILVSEESHLTMLPPYVLSHPGNLLSGNVTSSTTWSGIKWVNGNVYIKPGVTVTNNSFLFIDDNKKIIIEDGAILRLGGVTTKYTNADIQVNQGGTLIILPPILKEGAVDEENKSALPTEYKLIGNYPNPFNPSTTISYYLPEESNIELIIFNTLGQKVREFVLANQSSGTHKIVWDGMNDMVKRFQAVCIFTQ